MTAERQPGDVRLEQIPWLGATGLSLVRGALVVIVGVGNIGSQLARHLAALGIRLLLIDRDIVKPENFATQQFSADFGLSKAEARARTLASLNPLCRVEHLCADVRHLGMGVPRTASLLVSCVDSIEARAAINLLAVRLEIPWVDAAIDGTGKVLFGRVAAYDPRHARGACFVCPHTSASLGRALAAGKPAGCSTAWRSSGVEAPPTLAVSALGGVAASIQATWALKILLGRAAEVAGKEVYFDLDRGTMAPHDLPFNPRCLLDHRPWALVPLGSDAHRSTVAQTFEAAECRLPGHGEVSLRLPARSVVLRVSCPACGAERQLARVAECVTDGEASCACGSAMLPGAMDTVSCFRRDQAAGLLHRTWAEIGLPEDDVVVASRDLHETAFLLGVAV